MNDKTEITGHYTGHVNIPHAASGTYELSGHGVYGNGPATEWVALVKRIGDIEVGEIQFDLEDIDKVIVQLLITREALLDKRKVSNPEPNGELFL